MDSIQLRTAEHEYEDIKNFFDEDGARIARLMGERRQLMGSIENLNVASVAGTLPEESVRKLQRLRDRKHEVLVELEKACEAKFKRLQEECKPGESLVLWDSQESLTPSIGVVSRVAEDMISIDWGGHGMYLDVHNRSWLAEISMISSADVVMIISSFEWELRQWRERIEDFSRSIVHDMNRHRVTDPFKPTEQQD